mgnify:CR=1 FL=1
MRNFQKAIFLTLVVIFTSTQFVYADAYQYLSDTYEKQLEDQLMDFVFNSSDVATKTTYTPLYIVKYHERVNLLTSYQDFWKVLHMHDGEIAKVRVPTRRINHHQAIDRIKLQVLL